MHLSTWVAAVPALLPGVKCNLPLTTEKSPLQVTCSGALELEGPVSGQLESGMESPGRNVHTMRHAVCH